MMNFELPNIPSRPKKPRSMGLTMVMDKGLSLREAEDLISSSAHLVDMVKLGFGTSMVTPNLKEKIKLYQSNDINCFLGGTLFEAFVARNMFEDYRKLVADLGLAMAEVSDGSITMPHDQKCGYIRTLAQDLQVVSEVGSKEEGLIIHPNKWTSMMKKELEAGSWKVIAEARESGTVGIYHTSGKTHTLLIDKILAKISRDSIIWEAPQKSQQVWFIRNQGANVNLGNIAPTDAVALETLRLGLRGDTFFQFLPKKF
jgi:phosphosulfolactate synthase